MNDLAVRAEGLGKRFLVLRSQRTALRALSAFLSGESLKRELWVLRDFSIRIPRGAKLALIGRNGSGKTTFLRLLSGIWEPTCGRLAVSSRPRPMFSAEVGFTRELSVIENAFLFGAVHGIGRRDLAPKLGDLLAKIGLEDLAHVPLKDLSTGQVQRLALSIFAESDADLVIFDEVLRNVDLGFLREADRYFRSLASSSRTVIMTSHDTEFLRAYCTTAVWLDGGRVRLSGDFESVVAEYERSFDPPSLAPAPPAPPRIAAVRA